MQVTVGARGRGGGSSRSGRYASHSTPQGRTLKVGGWCLGWRGTSVPEVRSMRDVLRDRPPPASFPVLTSDRVFRSVKG